MSEQNEMTCAELADVAAELALGVLTGRERAVAVAHLDTCDTCREDVRQLMATGEQLLELLPSAEPPAGFESRVLDRLGLPAPAQGRQYPQLIQEGGSGPSRRPPAHKAPRRSGDRPSTDRPSTDRSGADRPGTGRPGTIPATPGATRRPGRMRRALAAAAVGVAVIAAGFGGWRIGVGSAPSASSAGPLASASLLSSTRQHVGDIFLYTGSSRWLYMSVDMGLGDEPVTCQVVSADGRVTTVGSFRLSGGYGSWGSQNPADTGKLVGARLVSANGTVLATATFPRW
jgi:hypothetical protein